MAPSFAPNRALKQAVNGACQSFRTLWTEIQPLPPVAEVDPVFIVAGVSVAHRAELHWDSLAHSTSPSLLATLQHDARHYLVDAFVHKFV